MGWQSGRSSVSSAAYYTSPPSSIRLKSCLVHRLLHSSVTLEVTELRCLYAPCSANLMMELTWLQTQWVPEGRVISCSSLRTPSCRTSRGVIGQMSGDFLSISCSHEAQVSTVKPW
ncbi:unnamed protein product [Pleuronectes platessa]|uniref:Uncharacterized protein n=1 Tax=Pleuronectes platessa TaxID=8262 RepID=A0A9N7VL48_PLEPL|nr:unnamed protein product [Pleuronectes platessa]